MEMSPRGVWNVPLLHVLAPLPALSIPVWFGARMTTVEESCRRLKTSAAQEPE
jgi:hypothetical protein